MELSELIFIVNPARPSKNCFSSEVVMSREAMVLQNMNENTFYISNIWKMMQSYPTVVDQQHL